MEKSKRARCSGAGENKSKRARCSGAGENKSKREDRLSALPDNILINSILSLLPMREAQRTSVLARRWRYLWLYVPCLDLDGSPKVARFRPNPRIISGFSTAELEDSASKYAEWVDRTIAAYRGTTALRHFRVLFRLGLANSSTIDSWLAFALRQGVEVLELDCCCTFVYPRYTLGLSVDHSLFPNIRLLKSLTLNAVCLPTDPLERLLSACCETLETLHLAHVSGLTRVSVAGPAVSRLKHIHIDCCDILESIAIRAPTPDLVSFTYPARKQVIGVYIDHAPRLVDLRLRVFHGTIMSSLTRFLPQLEALHLVYFTDDDEDIIPWCDFPPVLSRLKHLKMDFIDPVGSRFLRKKLRRLKSLIKRAPFLQHITLEVGGLWLLDLRREIAYMRLVLPAPVIEIAGLNWSQKVDRELALHLIRASPKLEKLIIDRRHPSLRGFMLGPYQHEEDTVKRWVNVVKKKIGPKLPPNAKLVII